jgi:TPR repeat protein
MNRPSTHRWLPVYTLLLFGGIGITTYEIAKAPNHSDGMGYVLLGVILVAIRVGVCWGIYTRKLWGWYSNFGALFAIPLFKGLIVVNYSASAHKGHGYGPFFLALAFWYLVYALPNTLYFRKRKYLFDDGKGPHKTMFGEGLHVLDPLVVASGDTPVANAGPDSEGTSPRENEVMNEANKQESVQNPVESSVEMSLDGKQEVPPPQSEQNQEPTVRDVSCPSCGAMNEPIAHYCGECCAALLRKCPECGVEDSSTKRFCISCGTDEDGFLAAQELLQRLEKHTATKEWSLLLERSTSWDADIKLPGDKGISLRERITSKIQTAQQSIKSIARLEKEIADLNNQNVSPERFGETLIANGKLLLQRIGELKQLAPLTAHLNEFETEAKRRIHKGEEQVATREKMATIVELEKEVDEAAKQAEQQKRDGVSTRVNDERLLGSLGCLRKLKSLPENLRSLEREAYARVQKSIRLEKELAEEEQRQVVLKDKRRNLKKADAFAVIVGLALLLPFLSLLKLYNEDRSSREAYQAGIQQCEDRNYSAALASFKKADGLGNRDAQYRIGCLYVEGQGVAQDFAEAEKWLRKAVTGGNKDAADKLSELFVLGKIKPESTWEEEQWLLVEAEKGDADSQFRLGEISSSYAASDWFQKAANQGHMEAQYKLAEKYYYGNGIAQDYAEAGNWYRKAAEQGHADAQYSLGLIYEYAKGVAPDLVEAVKWLRKAAEQGHSAAQNNLGVAYARGEGVAQSYTEAVKWYRKAAEQGEAYAQNNLGARYYSGTGVAKDYAVAVKWYWKAAEQGQVSAQRNLAGMYQDGLGVAASDSEAAKWYLKAGMQGDEESQRQLAEIYRYGKGVPRDAIEAAAWYSIVSDNETVSEDQRRNPEYLKKGSDINHYLLGVMSDSTKLHKMIDRKEEINSQIKN